MDRLLAKVTIDHNGCWLWMGSQTGTGYGSITIHNKVATTHVESYKIFKGPTKGLCVLHQCDVRNCINPDHLWLGTKGDNNRDAARKGRSHGFRTNGENNGNAILTNAQAAQIRELAKSGMMQRDIAKKFLVREMVISNIVTGKTYKC